MSPWIYIFSKFTPEALLFESLILFLLACLYTAFWVLKKRRYGSVEDNIPSGPVKSYLNELISHAEHLRLQLFGLLSSSDHGMGVPYNSNGPHLGDLGGDLKLSQLELKVTEQANAIDLLIAEKSLLEKELSESKAGGATAGEMGPLQAKVEELEGKLAEYSVIEDDLANLKRLQQENTQLKAQLAAAGAAKAATPSSAAPAATPTPPEAAAPPSNEPAPPQPDAPSEPAQAASPAVVFPNSENSSEASASSGAPTQSSPAAEKSESAPAVETPAVSAASAADFDALAGQIESSLQNKDPVSPQPPSDLSPVTAQPKAGSEEAELVAEFEKMLKT